jgi:hypothetical protein
MSAPGKFEDQIAIQEFPAKATSKLLPYGCSATAIFARNRDDPYRFHLIHHW